MVAGKALRALQAGGDRRHRQRRGVGGQHRIGADDALQLGEQALLDVQLFDDGLDHQVAAGQLGQAGGRTQALLVRGGIGGVQAAFVDQLVPLGAERVARLGDGIGLGVEQQHGAAGLRGNLGNAAPHGAGAHDADRVKAGRVHGDTLWRHAAPACRLSYHR